MTKVIIAMDSYKGCLTSQQVCRAAARGIEDACPEAELVEVPLSDGGEGMTEVWRSTKGGTTISVNVHDPLMRPITAQYLIANDGNTAVIEMASACGLPLVEPELRNPELTTTYGLGEMMADAWSRGCHEMILGIGGSATNDAGMGMLQALGARIELKADSAKWSKNKAMNGGMLHDISRIDITAISEWMPELKVMVACDVQNPLAGPEGAAHVFAPQKGADPEMVKRLDEGLKHLLAICGNPATLPGDGAAGGLGFALRHFMSAQMKPGIDLVLDAVGFDSLIDGATLVITGEGHSDRQTLMGKVPHGVLRRTADKNIPTCLLAGGIDDVEELRAAGFAQCRSINEGCDAQLSYLMQEEVALSNLRRAARIIFPGTDA